jgi:hypothetical protein
MEARAAAAPLRAGGRAIFAICADVVYNCLVF